MQTVSLTQAKQNFYEIIEKVTAGEIFVITKYGKPTGKIIAIKVSTSRLRSKNK